MTFKRMQLFVLSLTFTVALGGLAVAQSILPLSSWKEGKTKQSIIEFVADVTKNGSPSFVPPAERIAVFDNDGTQR